MSDTLHRFRVSPGDDGQRLDKFLAAKQDGLSRSRLADLIREGKAEVDGHVSRPSALVRTGSEVLLRVPPPRDDRIVPEAIPLTVLHEEPSFFVLDKPAGMVVHPGAGNREGTLVAALLHRDPDLAGVGGEGRSGLVHRLDKGTTGVMVVARTEEAHRGLSAQFQQRKVQKMYDALLWGRPKEGEGWIDRPVGRDPRVRIRMSTGAKGGRAALSHFRVVEDLPGFAWVEVQILTGRTHQIRVHLQSIGHPLIGDETYGGARARSVADRSKRGAIQAFPRPALHARRLVFSHPLTGNLVTFEAPWPQDMVNLWKALGGHPRP